MQEVNIVPLTYTVVIQLMITIISMEAVDVYFVHWDIMLHRNRNPMGGKVMPMNVSNVPRENTLTSRGSPSVNHARHRNTKIRSEVHPARIAFRENSLLRKSGLKIVPVAKLAIMIYSQHRLYAVQCASRFKCW